MMAFLGGSGEGLSGVPVVMIDKATSDTLRERLASGERISASLKRDPATDRDGTLDTLIVAHEWGHYISNRLIGDGAGIRTHQSSGLGEGWADFHALLLTVKESDAAIPSNADFNGAYPLAQYTSFGQDQKTGYYCYGIRRAPYSTDMAKNPLTFKHIQDGTPLPQDGVFAFGKDGAQNSEVHNTGEVWASMLWECYAALLRDQAHNRSFAEKQDLMKKYIVAAYKMTPASPTLLEARDAVLAAALAHDTADYEMFWKAFAKRGAGKRAQGPDRNSKDNKGVVESYAVGADIAIAGIRIKDAQEACVADGIFDTGDSLSLEVAVKNVGIGAVTPTAVISSQTSGIVVAGGGFINFPPLGPMKGGVGTASTWTDVGGKMSPAYTDTLATDGTKNALAGRLALSGISDNFPAFNPASLKLGPAFAGQTVYLRFRVGSDEGTAFFGWAIDDIKFDGITNTPFTKRVPNVKQSCPR